jgi:hypothetical protein
MYYFEHYIHAAGLRSVGRAAILRVTEEAWVYEDLRAEILDAFPAADVAIVHSSSVPEALDLLVLPVTAEYKFPFHDVVYESLEQLAALMPLRGRARYLMIYRTRWREVEVVAAPRFPARLRKRRLEAFLIRACRQSPLLRRILRPHYPC